MSSPETLAHNQITSLRVSKESVFAAFVPVPRARLQKSHIRGPLANATPYRNRWALIVQNVLSRRLAPSSVWCLLGTLLYRAEIPITSAVPVLTRSASKDTVVFHMVVKVTRAHHAEHASQA
jgi:hypothetical protein